MSQSEKSPTPDEIWIARRQGCQLCHARIAADLRQLADKIEQLGKKQSEKEKKIKELLGFPNNMSNI